MAFVQALRCSYPNSVSSSLYSPQKLFRRRHKCFFSALPSSSVPQNSKHISSSSSFSTAVKSMGREEPYLMGASTPALLFPAKDSPFSGLEEVMMGYLLGKKKATQVAHSVWKHVVQKGDTLVDATCGNGHDTLAMLKLIAGISLGGRVYGMDIQQAALENTISLLDRSLNSDEKEPIELFTICHSKMEEVVPRDVTVRLVAFNLGYLPGGDKTLITRSETTILGLEAAQRILAPGGLISLVVYIGHPGGMEEFEKIEAFASGLPVDDWICCKLQMLNRPSAPIPVFLFKR